MVNVVPFLNKIWYSRFKNWKKILPPKATPINIRTRTRGYLREKLYFILKYGDFILYLQFFVLYCINKGWKSAQSYPQFMSDNEYDAIIIVHEKIAEKYMYGCGIDLLIDFFREKEIPYKLYHCYDLNTFEEIVRNQKAVNLWLFGHGSRGSISCGNQFIKYEKLKDAPRKGYVYQFHCNHGNDTSLAEYLSNGRGYVNNRTSNMIQNREHIKQILKYWRETEEHERLRRALG
ncbi:MAG: hypothetical protein WA977_05135 [Halobacteriota archaeon]